MDISHAIILILGCLVACKAKDLCKDFCTCTDTNGMKEVDCKELSIKTYPGSADLPVVTIKLDLSRNEIEVLDSLEELDGLKSLSLYFNKIKTIEPNAFDKYISLEALDLSKNELSKLETAALTSLQHLKVLNISHNYIRSLPDDIFYNLINLEELRLSGNPMHMLRYELFRQSETIKILDISNIALDHLEPNLFHGLVYLEELDISGNHFEEVPKKGLASAPRLKYLKMNRNSMITLLAEGDFRKLGYLETLEISDMPGLTTIESGAFSGLKALRVLKITSNPNLHTLNFGAFEGLYSTIDRTWLSLKELHLRQNGLRTVASPSSSLCQIPVLDIQQNPWDCDCNMQWISKCAIRIELTPEITCARPKHLNGKNLVAMDQEDLVCISMTLLEHQKKVLRVVVITSAIVGLFLCGLIIVVVIKRHQILEWWSYRKRGSGAVYYVKADANANEPLDA